MESRDSPLNFSRHVIRRRKIRRKRDGKKEARIFDIFSSLESKSRFARTSTVVNHHRLVWQISIGSDDFTGKRDPPSASLTEKYLQWSREEKKRTAEFPGVRLSRKKARCTGAIHARFMILRRIERFFLAGFLVTLKRRGSRIKISAHKHFEKNVHFRCF